VVIDADIAVIGAGMAGASIAAELSQSHAVLLLDREERPGYHSTGRSAALYSEAYGGGAVRALSRASRAFLTAPQSNSSPFASPRGCLRIAAAAQLDELARFAANPDVASVTTLLGAMRTKELLPALRADFAGGALHELNAYDLDVDALHNFFLRQLRVNDGNLLCASEALTIERMSDHWIVAAGDRRLRARILVNAAGAWGDVVARRAGVDALGLQPLRRTAFIVDPPLGQNVSEWPAVIDIDEQFYFKPDAGRVLMSPANETPSDPVDAQPEELEIAIAVDRIQAIAEIPVKSVKHKWAGLRTFAPDRLPVVGFDASAPNFFWFVGQGGYGIQTAPAAARLAAALVRCEPAPSDIVDQGLNVSSLTPARFQRQANAPARGGAH